MSLGSGQSRSVWLLSKFHAGWGNGPANNREDALAQPKQGFSLSFARPATKAKPPPPVPAQQPASLPQPVETPLPSSFNEAVQSAGPAAEQGTGTPPPSPVQPQLGIISKASELTEGLEEAALVSQPEDEEHNKGHDETESSVVQQTLILEPTLPGPNDAVETPASVGVDADEPKPSPSHVPPHGMATLPI